jgi:hypothetical protein
MSREPGLERGGPPPKYAPGSHGMRKPLIPRPLIPEDDYDSEIERESSSLPDAQDI